VSEETRSILERAHETAEEITSRSRAQADDRVQVAEQEAAKIREAAERRVYELDTDAEAIWAERMRLIGDVRDVADRLHAVADEATARFPSAHPDHDVTQALPAGASSDDETVEVFDAETVEGEAESSSEPEQQQ